MLCQTAFTLQDALAAELDAAELLVTPSRPQPRQLEFSDLSKLTYLNALFKESQRLHPTAPFGTNRCARQAGHLINIVQSCLAVPCLGLPGTAPATNNQAEEKVLLGPCSEADGELSSAVVMADKQPSATHSVTDM